MYSYAKLANESTMSRGQKPHELQYVAQDLQHSPPGISPIIKQNDIIWDFWTTSPFSLNVWVFPILIFDEIRRTLKIIALRWTDVYFLNIPAYKSQINYSRSSPN